MTFLRELRFACRSLRHAKGLAGTIVLTLALGIGANAAIFSLVRAVLLRPLANRDEGRLLYIRQSAPGMGIENTTFSMPEIRDLRASVKAIRQFGDFSTAVFPMAGLGDPHEVRAGIVDGSYFEVMGLRPVLGRLLGPADDDPNAAGAIVLTNRFWATALRSDPSVLGKTVRLGTRTATVVGVLEPSVPYPVETEILANVVTSPHHLSATMVQGRAHRMTELFGRLAPGVTLESALADLRAAHAAMMHDHPDAYSPKAGTRIDAVRLRDQITAKARTRLLILLSASALIFLIACCNVANLVLARTVRREGELALRSALGAGATSLRRGLLAESLVLSGAGAALGVLIAQPLVSVLAKYAARFSVRATDVTVDSSLLWSAAALAVAAAVALAFVPRLPSAGITRSARVAGGASGRLRAFAVTQIAASFILLVGAAVLLRALFALQTTDTGFDTRHVLALNLPVVSYGRTPEQTVTFYRQVVSRVRELPDVEQVALGTQIPWRDAGSFGPGFQFAIEGHVKSPGEEDLRAQFRTVSPGYFAALRAPIVAGRDFNELDRRGSEPVVIVSQSLARRLFPNQDVLNRRLQWTDPIVAFIGIGRQPRRIVGVAADVDDENVVPRAAITVYQPFGQEQARAGRLFIHTHGDPYAVLPSVQRTIRELSADQPVERAATLADIRADILSPERLNALVLGGFAALALAIAVVGVAGVLAFSVTARTKEFGIRLALGSQPRDLILGVVAQGAAMSAGGVAAGTAGGYALERLAGSFLQLSGMPGMLPSAGAAVVLLGAAAAASLVPAMRAARVDILQALQ